MILVGGFAGSPYLLSQLTEWCARKGIKITRPDGPTAKAVVNGALTWALTSTVQARVARWWVPLIYLVPKCSLAQALRHRCVLSV